MLGQKEPFSDVAIPISLLDVAQNVKFTSREPFIAEMLGQPSRDLGQDPIFAIMDLPNGLEHLAGRHALQQIGAGSPFQPLAVNTKIKALTQNFFSSRPLHRCSQDWEALPPLNQNAERWSSVDLDPRSGRVNYRVGSLVWVPKRIGRATR